MKQIDTFNFKSLIKCLLFMMIMMSFNQAVKPVNITFRVDMHDFLPNDVYVGSDWAGWDPAKFQQLTDADHDSIFEITIDLPAGASYNYRYKIGARDWNNFEDLSSGPCGAGPAKQDRNIKVSTTATTLPVYCFSSCTDCQSTTKMYLSLSVDMNDQEVSPDGVHVAGSFNSWNPASTLMEDKNGDGIYTTTIRVLNAGVHEYKFFNGNKNGTEEQVFGPCEFRSNRIAEVSGTSTTVPVVKFGYCSDNAEPTKDIKIGCIGNSITSGGGTLSNVYTKSWPIQLRDLLGSGYYAENLGVSGRTLLKTGDYPWWNEPQYQYTFELQPDIVVIKLGTNDSKPYNWNAEKFKTDYMALIDSLRTMTHPPKIYISTPAKAYSSAFDISDKTINSQIIPILREIAKEKLVSLIDMYKATSGISSEFPDGIHPNDNGAKVVANKVKEALLKTKPTIGISDTILNNLSDNNFNWYLNGKLIANSNYQSIEITQTGDYQLAVKSSYTDDVLVSDTFNVDLTSSGKTSLFLSSQGITPTNYAFSFVNRTDVLNIGGQDLTPPWTAEMWVNKKASSEYSSLLNGSSCKINLETYGENQKIGITSKGVADWVFPKAYIVPLNTWTHLAFVCNGTKTYLYVNGTVYDSLSQAINLPMSSLGNNAQTESPNANLDEIRLWKIARNGTEILDNMNKSVNPANINLIGYWNADDVAVNPTDISPMANVCTKSGVTYVENTNTAFSTELPEMRIKEVSAENLNEYMINPASSNQDILAINVNVTGIKSPQTLSHIIVNLNGTTALSDLSQAKIYYTGNSKEFATTTPFGSAQLVSTGNFTFIGNQLLKPGNNYFWLCVDVNANSIKGNLVDGELVSVSVENNIEAIVPAVSSPVGKRVILERSSISNASGGLTLIPKPSSMVVNEGTFSLNATTNIIASNSEAKLEGDFMATFLNTATGYSLSAVIGDESPNSINLILVNDANLKTEGYSIDVLADRVNIKANTRIGLFWGFQTLRQLLPAKIESQQAIPDFKWVMPLVNIVDYPRFQHRGSMLDVCRHYFSTDMVKRYIDMLVMYKMNVFHWHLSEDQGWRVESKRFPKLNTISSMRDCPDKYGMVYTQDEIKDIVAYAATRHVEVIPEIEMPGHSVEVLAAYPELGCTSGTKPYSVRCEWGVSQDMYCPGKDTTINFLKAVLEEIIPLFPSKYFHIGGDETPFDKWATCSDCAKRIKAIGASGKTDSTALLKQWMLKQIQDYLTSKGKTMIGWTEITHGGIPSGAVIQDWLEQAAYSAAVKGNDVIQSFAGYLYLDNYQTGNSNEPPASAGVHSLEMVYAYNPIPNGLTADQQKHIIGIEAPMWTEHIDNEKHLQYMLVPRIQGVAENCWSLPANKDIVDFKKRLFYHFERFDSLHFNNRKLDPPAVSELSTENLSNCSSLELKAPFTAGAYFWTDNLNSQTPSLTVTKSGTYKLYMDWFGKQLSKTYNVVIKQETSKPDIEVNISNDTTITISGDADDYNWYNSTNTPFYLGNTLTANAETNNKQLYITGVRSVVVKNSLSFNATGSYVNSGDISALSKAIAFTFETWVKLSSWNNWGGIFRKSAGTSSRIGLELGDKGNDLYCEVGNGSNTYGFANGCIETGLWYHLAMVYNSAGSSNASRLKLYINGSEVILSYSGTIPATTPTNKIKLLLNDPTYYFSGQMADTRIWSTARSASEIALNMYTEIPAFTNGLLANYKFMDSSGTLAHDATNKFNGTLINFKDQPWSTDGPTISRMGCESELWPVPMIVTSDKVILTKESDNHLLVYPNPSKSILTIQSLTSNIQSIKIINQTGQILNSQFQILTSDKYKTNISQLANGIYYVEVLTIENKAYQALFIKN